MNHRKNLKEASQIAKLAINQSEKHLGACNMQRALRMQNLALKNLLIAVNNLIVITQGRKR